VVAELRGRVEIGDGELNRIIRRVQRHFLVATPP
jgi:hypothetical protein